MCLAGNKRAYIARVIPCKNNFCTKFAHHLHFWFTKVKYVKSSSFSSSIESTQSLFYRFNRNILVHNKLQILSLIQTVTGSKKAIHSILLTTDGLTRNGYIGDIQEEIRLYDLYELKTIDFKKTKRGCAYFDTPSFFCATSGKGPKHHGFTLKPSSLKLIHVPWFTAVNSMRKY